MTVLVGGKKLPDVSIKRRHDEALVIKMPPGPKKGGKVDVVVQQPGVKGGAKLLTSNALEFEYLDDSTKFVPVKFRLARHELPSGVVRLRYCFGHVFFTTHNSGAAVYYGKLNDDYSLGELTKITTIGEQGVMYDKYLELEFHAESVLGVQCDPWGSDDNFDVYFSLSYTFWNDVGPFGPDVTTYFPFLGSVVKLSSADDFATLEWVVQNLPVSAHDHAVNQVDFLNDRRLLIAVGGQTNAGYPMWKYGGMQESALSAAILAAPVTKPGFNGKVQYKFVKGAPKVHKWYEDEGTPLPVGERMVTNQRWGDWLQPTGEDDVTIYASGTRNPFDLVVTP